jgi:acetyltransferase
MLLFGAGGRLVEIAGDHTLAVPPLTTTLARRMIERTRIARVLTADRSLDLGALERLLVHFSRLVVEQRWIKEIDINPLFVGPGRLLALDARTILHAPDTAEEALPRLAIRPYPAQYIAPWAMKDGTPVTIRPIRPEDEPLMVEFHKTLSDQSVYTRYFYPMQLSQRIAHERLTRICFIDYDREMALVVDRHDRAGAVHQILAVGRLVKLRGKMEAEFAVLVSDLFQGQGLGIELLRRLLAIGRDEGLQRISGDILPENRAMQRVCEKLGFHLRRSFDEPVKAIIDL